MSLTLSFFLFKDSALLAPWKVVDLTSGAGKSWIGNPSANPYDKFSLSLS